MPNSDRQNSQKSIESSIKFANLMGEGKHRRLLLAAPCSQVKISIPLQGQDKVPASGIFLGENMLPQIEPGIKKVLGLGSGKYAPAEFCCVTLWGVPKIDGVEIEEDETEIANEIARLNGLSNRVKIYSGSLFEPVADRDYDLIFSNIAQLPLQPGTTPSCHDHGGEDGWLFLDKIIQQSPAFLKSGGLLSLLVFDFLGIIDRTNPKKLSLAERLKQSHLAIIHRSSYRRVIRPGGQTHRAIAYILQLYPNARFYDQAGRLVANCDVPKSLANGRQIFLDFFVVTAKLGLTRD